jgi:hypothetical protein
MNDVGSAVAAFNTVALSIVKYSASELRMISLARVVLPTCLAPAIKTTLVSLRASSIRFVQFLLNIGLWRIFHHSVVNFSPLVKGLIKLYSLQS